MTATVERPGAAPTSPLRSPRAIVSLLALAAVGVVVVKYGISWHPEWARLQDAAVHWPDLASSPLITEGDRALLSNVSLAAIAGLVGAVSVPAYFAVSGACAVIALVLPFAMRWRSPTFARLAFIVIAGGAVAPVLLAWVGGYDAIVVIAAVVAALGRRHSVSALGWLALGFSHSAVALTGLLLWLPVMWAAEREPVEARMRRAAIAVASAAVGWLVIRGLTDAWGGSTDRLALLRAIEPSGLASSFAVAAPLVVFGAFGVAWLLFLDRGIWSIRSSRWMLGAALVAGIGLPLVAVDQTRIVALSLVAAVMAWIDDVADRQDSGRVPLPDPSLSRTWLVAGAIVPVPVVWMGAVLYPGWATLDDWLALLGIG